MPRKCQLPRTLGSLEGLFSFLEESLEENRIDARTSYCLQLSAEELFTNMVRHNVGKGENISIGLDITPQRILLELIDHEVEPFDPESVEAVDVTRPVEQRRPGGLGMHLVRSLVDSVSYDYEDRQMRVSVIKKLGGG